ncbi:hypothetical protein D3C79_821070 [compost metagenome]
MRHDRRKPPAVGLEGPAQQGFENQADEAEQLPGVLPDGADGTADTLEQQQQHRAFGLLDRNAVVLHRAVHGLEQGTAGVGQAIGAVRQAFGAEQFGQQRGAGGVETAQLAEVGNGVVAA